MLVPLTLEKSVTLNNYRLKACFNVVLALSCVFVGTELWLAAAWAKKTVMIDKVRFSLWPSESQNRDSNNYKDLPMCANLGLYDYQYDAEGVWLYQNYTCARACDWVTMDGNCFLRQELVQFVDDGVFYVTALRRAHVVISTNKSNSLNVESSFIPVENEHRFNLSYNFYVPSFELSSVNNFWRASSFKGNSNTDIMTVVMNAKGEPQRNIPPNTYGIQLQVKELLTLANRPNWLDEPQSELGKNLLNGAAYPTGPVGRLTGIEITLRIHCYNNLNLPQSLQKIDWKHGICTLEVSPAPPRWNSKSRLDSNDGMARITTYNGIFLRVSTEVEIHLFSAIALMTWIANAWVMLRLPYALFSFIIRNCLGKLSNIYTGAIVENFYLSQHLCSLAIEIVTRNKIYNLIRDKQEGISLSQMTTYIASSLTEFHELDNSEIQAFSLFCFALAFDMDRYHSHRLQHSLTKKLMNLKPGKTRKRAPSTVEFEQSELNATHFAVASSMSNTIVLDHMVSLFDRDRQIGFMEGLFMPYFIRHTIPVSEQMIDLERQVAKPAVVDAEDPTMHLEIEGSLCEYSQDACARDALQNIKTIENSVLLHMQKQQQLEEQLSEMLGRLLSLEKTTGEQWELHKPKRNYSEALSAPAEDNGKPMPCDLDAMMREVQKELDLKLEACSAKISDLCRQEYASQIRELLEKQDNKWMTAMHKAADLERKLAAQMTALDARLSYVERTCFLDPSLEVATHDHSSECESSNGNQEAFRSTNKTQSDVGGHPRLRMCGVEKNDLRGCM